MRVLVEISAGVDVSVICWPTAYYLLFTELKRVPLKLNRSSTVMRGLDPRIHLLAKEDGLPGQARQ
jgi:hypothetical protein